MLASFFKYIKKNDILNLCVYTTALCCLFSLLNPALIFYPESFYPLAFSFWLQLTGLGLSASLLLTGLLLPFHLTLCRFFSVKGKGIIPGLIAAAFITFFCISIFFPQETPLQDGTFVPKVNFSEVLPLYAIYTFAYIFITALAFTKTLLFKRLFFIIILFCSGIVCYEIIVTVHQYSKIPYLTDKTDLSFGKKKNIIVIVADMLQGSFVEQTINLHPELKNKFNGFTAYTRAMTPFPFTNFALPAILTGKTYAGAKQPVSYEENLEIATKDSFMTDSIKKGYIPTALGTGLINFDPEQIFYSTGRTWDSWFAILKSINISFLRIFKKDYFDKNYLKNKDYITSAKTNGINLLLRFLHEPLSLKENKKIFLLHIMTPHTPVATYNIKGTKTELFIAEEQYNPETVLSEVNFFLNLLAKFIDHLKQLNIYDDSLIIIVGDHGHHAGINKAFKDIPGGEDFDAFETGFWTRIAGLYNPILLIKMPEAKNRPLEVSRKAIANTDIRTVIQNWLQHSELKSNLNSSPNSNLNSTSNKYNPDKILNDILNQENREFDILLVSPKNSSTSFSSENHAIFKLKGNISALSEMLRTPIIEGKTP